MRRRLALATVAAAAVVVFVVGLASPAATAKGGPTCPPADADEVPVRVVVDFGDVDGGADTPSVTCVVVARGHNGADVLEARARRLGTPPPRYAASGLLCAIDGLPETGCGDQTSTGYRYWAYFLGTATGWEHASVGPAFRDADRAVTEGWHFVDGAGRPGDPPPDAPADPATSAVSSDAYTRSTRHRQQEGGIPLGAVAGGAGVGLMVGAALVVSRRRRGA